MLDTPLTIWFLLTAGSTAYVAYDLLARTPVMGVMKLGWVLVMLYTGPVGLALYLGSCRKPAGQSHESVIRRAALEAGVRLDDPLPGR